jgi:hypothetical protein
VRPGRPSLARRWAGAETRLAAVYASSYLAIWHAIAGANSAAEESRLPALLARLLHRPDRARDEARALAEELQVPDCTGGDNTTAAPAFVVEP